MPCNISHYQICQIQNSVEGYFAKKTLFRYLPPLFDMSRTLRPYWISCIYFISVGAAVLRWHMSNKNVIDCILGPHLLKKISKRAFHWLRPSDANMRQ